MTKRKRLKRIPKKRLLQFEKESGIRIDEIFDYTKPKNIGKLIKGLEKGEAEIIKDIFEFTEKEVE